MASQDSQLFNGHSTALDDTLFQVRGSTLLYVVVLFAVVLLVTLLLLCTRWVCRNQHSPTAPPHQHKGLDPAVIRALPIVLYQQSGRDLEAGGGGGECCICLGVFEDGEKAKVLPSCHHCFHSECVDTWLAAQSSCPLCRAQFQAPSTSS